MNNNRPIGVFDSGVGGLTVLREIHKALPGESTIYVGDTARVPYGAKTPEQLLDYACEIIEFLLARDVKAVVIACGTSSAVTYENLRELYPDLVLIDVIRPVVKAEICGNIGLIATTATIRSGLFLRLLEEENPGRNITAQACPLFASMVEAGLSPTHPAVRFAAEAYLCDMKGRVDSLVLGCTHYPLLADVLRSVLGDIRLIDIGETCANEVKKRLAGQYASGIPSYKYYVTGADVENFRTIGSRIMGVDINILQHWGMPHSH